MDNRIAISIVVPVYNAEKYLKHCIDSILKQTFQNYEVIIVDDGSTDNSCTIAKQYAEKDSRVKLFSQTNGGPLKARIYGMLQSGGEYFTFCDSDDYYATKEALQILYETVLRDRVDVIQFGYYSKHKYLRYVGSVFTDKTINCDEFLSNEYPKLLCSTWENSTLSVTVWDKLYHSSLKRNVPNSLSYEHVFMGDDEIINLFLTEKAQSIMFLNRPLYCHRENSGLSHKWKKETMWDLNKIKEYQMYKLKEWEFGDKSKVISILFAELAAWFFLHIVDGIDELEKKEMIEYIKSVMELPMFIKGRDYYRNDNKENWEAVSLMREYDPDKYYMAALNFKQKNKRKLLSIKDWLRKMI